MTAQREMLLRDVLSSERSRLLHEIQATMRRAYDNGHDPDAAVDDDSPVGVEDIACAAIGLKTETLRRIGEALERLDNGDFGLCAECEEPIADARLSVAPFTTLCLDCQTSATGPKTPSVRYHPQLSAGRLT